jgi:hypothetical protein
VPYQRWLAKDTKKLPRPFLSSSSDRQLLVTSVQHSEIRSTVMASHMAMKSSSMALRRLPALSFAFRRCITTSLRANSGIRTSKPMGLQRAALQHSFRRAYSDAPTASLSPTPKPKKRFRLLRWTWRLTYLSAIGFAGWLAYTVWELRNPNEQFEPDPSKKTLVILGTLAFAIDGLAFANCWQGRVGAQYLYSRNLTQRTTMLL